MEDRQEEQFNFVSSLSILVVAAALLDNKVVAAIGTCVLDNDLHNGH